MAIANNYSPYASGYPVDVTAISVGGGGMQLDWTAPNSIFGVVSGYRVYRAYTVEEHMSPIGVTVDTTFTDSGVEDKRDYFYRVTTIYGDS